MKIGICDDNTLHLNHLVGIVSEFFSNKNDVEIEALNPEDISTKINNRLCPYDIIISDIDMGIFNGIDLAEKINKINPSCKIIFVTNYINYATDIYDVEHIYFVLKADAGIYLPKALEKAMKLYEEKKKDYLLISNQNVETMIPVQDIMYIEAFGRYLYIYELNQKHKCIDTLKAVCIKLPDTFARCHHSYVINLKYIRSMSRTTCELTSGISIPISYTYSKDFRSSFTRYASKCL